MSASASVSAPASSVRGIVKGSEVSTRAGLTVGANAPLLELCDVSLKFVNFHDKQYSLKRAMLNRLLRRRDRAPASAFWALRDVNLTIRQGDRLGIVGGNGAGKSTLLRLLARIYPPTEGRFSVRGAVVPLIEMGAGFNAELSGEENIYLNGAIFGYSRAAMAGKIATIMDFAGLADFARLPLKYYSSGMYMRLAFAIATEVEPDILLIDEALSVGDAAFVEKAKQRVRSLIHRANAVIVVSHDLPTLHELCTRGIWLDHGRIVAEGPMADVIDAYLGRSPA